MAWVSIWLLLTLWSYLTGTDVQPQFWKSLNYPNTLSIHLPLNSSYPFICLSILPIHSSASQFFLSIHLPLNSSYPFICLSIRITRGLFHLFIYDSLICFPSALPIPYLSYLPYHTLSYLTLPYLTLPYLTLPYLTLPYLTLPYLTLPYLTLP